MAGKEKGPEVAPGTQQVQAVAQIEEGGRLKDVMGIPLDNFRDIGIFALRGEGLVHIRMAGMFWDNGVEGTHVYVVEKISGDWDKIQKLTGLSQGNVSGMFDEYERPTVEEPV